jgi:hypothetical protein
LGQLSLSLRRPDDATEVGGDGISIHTLLGASPDSANANKASTPSTSPNFLEFLNSQPQPAPQVAADAPPSWLHKMQVLTPTGLKEFRWRSLEEMPEEVTYGQPAPSAEASPTPAGSQPAAPTAEEEDSEEKGDSATDSGAAEPRDKEDAA